jgi:hypothetical protein
MSIRNCLCVYSFDKNTIQFADFAESMFKLCYQINLKSNLFGTEINGKSSRLLKKETTFRSRLKAHNNSEFDVIEFYVSDQNDTYSTVKWRVYVAASNREWRNYSNIFIGIPDSNFEYNFENLKYILSDISQVMEIQYGFYFQREIKYSPEFFSWGTGSGNISSEESERINKWSFPQDEFKLGRIREVFPYNILSAKHLDYRIAKATFKEWIQSSKNHGNLLPFSKGVWIWEVKPENIPSISKDLEKYDFLVCT